jgi:adenylate cyclase
MFHGSKGILQPPRCRAAIDVLVRQIDGSNFASAFAVGGIIIDDNDIFGDGVNIAARLDGVAEPGGICISDDAQRHIRGNVDIAFDDMGSQTLKNIAERDARLARSAAAVGGVERVLVLDG